jgi:hypothetical protein
MAFYDRDYEVYVILGSAEMPELWLWDRWKTVAELFAPFTTVPRGKAALRGDRYVPNPKRPGAYKPQGLGRIGWDRRSHEKWTFGSTLTKNVCSDWKFARVEAWAPSWNVCERERTAPDFYFQMTNENMLGLPNSKLAFNPVIIIAASVSLDHDYRLGARRAAGSLSSFVESKLFVCRQRPWGYSVGPGFTGFSGAIQDLKTSGLFKVGDPHQRPVNLDTFAEQWAEVSAPDQI